MRHGCQRLLTRVSRPSLRKPQQQCERETKGGSTRYLPNPGRFWSQHAAGGNPRSDRWTEWSRPTRENPERWRSQARPMHSGAPLEQSKQISRISCGVETITAQRRSPVNWPLSGMAWSTWIWMERYCLPKSGRERSTPVGQGLLWLVSFFLSFLSNVTKFIILKTVSL